MTNIRKKMMILRGLPGSGKSTFARRAIEEGRKRGARVVVCSADDYFTHEETGEYKFNPERIGEAHRACFERALRATDPDLEGAEWVIVDNTNTTPHEIAPYYLLGETRGYLTSIYHFSIDIETAVSHNIHGVPRHAIEHMQRNMAIPIPDYWSIG